MTTTAQGTTIHDATGLGRWTGLTFEGKEGRKHSVITGYRVCTGSMIASSPLGSTFHQEYTFWKNQGGKPTEPTATLS